MTGEQAVAFLLFAVVGCRVTDLRVWTVPETLARDIYEVERVSGVCYYDGPDADGRQHRLDLFLPKGEKDFPVVLLVHGGAWMIGDNRCCGLYSSVGEFLASRGVGAVLPNYRLSPQVQHPEHVRDVARGDVANERPQLLHAVACETVVHPPTVAPRAGESARREQP